MDNKLTAHAAKAAGYAAGNSGTNKRKPAIEIAGDAALAAWVAHGSESDIETATGLAVAAVETALTPAEAIQAAVMGVKGKSSLQGYIAAAMCAAELARQEGHMPLEVANAAVTAVKSIGGSMIDLATAAGMGAALILASKSPDEAGRVAAKSIKMAGGSPSMSMKALSVASEQVAISMWHSNPLEAAASAARLYGSTPLMLGEAAADAALLSGDSPAEAAEAAVRQVLMNNGTAEEVAIAAENAAMVVAMGRKLAPLEVANITWRAVLAANCTMTRACKAAHAAAYRAGDTPEEATEAAALVEQSPECVTQSPEQTGEDLAQTASAKANASESVAELARRAAFAAAKKATSAGTLPLPEILRAAKDAALAAGGRGEDLCAAEGVAAAVGARNNGAKPLEVGRAAAAAVRAAHCSSTEACTSAGIEAAAALEILAESGESIIAIGTNAAEAVREIAGCSEEDACMAAADAASAAVRLQKKPLSEAVQAAQVATKAAGCSDSLIEKAVEGTTPEGAATLAKGKFAETSALEAAENAQHLGKTRQEIVQAAAEAADMAGGSSVDICKAAMAVTMKSALAAGLSEEDARANAERDCAKASIQAERQRWRVVNGTLLLNVSIPRTFEQDSRMKFAFRMSLANISALPELKIGVKFRCVNGCEPASLLSYFRRPDRKTMTLGTVAIDFTLIPTAKIGHRRIRHRVDKMEYAALLRLVSAYYVEDQGQNTYTMVMASKQYLDHPRHPGEEEDTELTVLTSEAKAGSKILKVASKHGFMIEDSIDIEESHSRHVLQNIATLGDDTIILAKELTQSFPPGSIVRIAKEEPNSSHDTIGANKAHGALNTSNISTSNGMTPKQQAPDPHIMIGVALLAIVPLGIIGAVMKLRPSSA
jgi:hypothetical protein